TEKGTAITTQADLNKVLTGATKMSSGDTLSTYKEDGKEVNGKYIYHDNTNSKDYLVSASDLELTATSNDEVKIKATSAVTANEFTANAGVDV
ncbi:flagellin FliC, partial [Escherichia coli]|nr:flagellin FliC [Escherichia coli]